MAWPAPTGIRPSNTVQTKNNPHLAANIVREPGNILRIKARWNIAADAGFTTELKSVGQPDTAYDFGGDHFLALPAGLSLHQGTWYIRALAVREISLATSPWSNTGTFVVSHPMTSKYNNPTGNIAVDYNSGGVRLAWLPIDSEPSATQSAVRVQIQTADGLTSLLDTGKIAHTNPFYDSIGDIDAHLDVPLRWRVVLWDDEDVGGPASVWSLFSGSLGPTLSVSAPSGVVATPGPTVTWTFTAAGGRPQIKFWIQIIDTDTSLLVYSSGQIAGAATSFIIPGPAIPNGSNLRVIVNVQDSGNFVKSASSDFSTAWTPPAQESFAVDITNYETFGYVDITWDNSSPDVDFLAWRIYRKLTSESVWQQIGPDLAVGVNEYLDFSANSNSSVDFAVAQVKLTDAVQVESAFAASKITESLGGDSYWLVDPDPNGLAIALFEVNAEDFSDEFETTEMLLIGAGRRVELGTEWGFRGTLTANLRDIFDGPTARQQRLDLEDGKRNGVAMYLRNPFGDVWKVFLPDISITRMAGLGIREYVTVTIPYTEVI